MSKVFTHMTMSLDGFVADPQDGVEELFGWYDAGSIHLPTADERWSFDVDEGSARLLREILASTGALVCGRRLFDHTRGWGDSHPVGAPVVVVTITPPMTRTHGRGPRSWMAWRRGSLARSRSPARTTSAS